MTSGNATNTVLRAERNRPAASTQRTQQRMGVWKTVRKTREKLTSESGNSIEFDRELLELHAKNWQASMLFLPLLLIMVSLVSTRWIAIEAVLMWAIPTFSAVLLTILVNVQFLQSIRKPKQERENKTLATWRRHLLVGDLLNGLCWAGFLLIGIQNDSPNLHVFQFTILLTVVASFSMMTAASHKGMLMATLPISICVFLRYGLVQDMSLTYLILLFAGAQGIFFLIAKQISNSAMQAFQLKAEKDGLIVELEQANGVSDESRRRAEEANLAKSRFLATMSHELRTPLNAILGFSEVLKNELLGPLDNPTYREYVGDIHSSGEHLLNLINEILDLSRIEAGKYELQEEAVNLNHIADDCVTLVQLRARNKEINIELESEDDLPRLWADERAIRQIMLNLLSNAIKFTPQNGEIALSVGWTETGGQYITVTDNGPGVPEEEIPIILSQFGQGSTAIKSAEQGTGLGLPIVQALVEMHGGTFDLQSKLRVGTQVTICFPKQRAIEALAPEKGMKAKANMRAEKMPARQAS